MWKLIKYKYFTVIIITKNILSILASKINVEHFFNTAWDTCHYHQNHLNTNIIKIIMLIKWYEKLELWTSENKSDLSEIIENQTSNTDEELMNE